MHHQGLLSFQDYYHDAKAFFHSLSACGAILLNPTREKVVLVTNNHYDLSFPKGKALQGEKSYDCAVREVTEETGIVIDVMSQQEIQRAHNFVPPPFSVTKARQAVSEPRRIALDPSVYISIEFKPQTYFKLFLIKDVHESMTFTPQVRNEIAKVEWHDLEQLTDRCVRAECPSHLRMVSPFMPLLNRWIKSNCVSPFRSQIHFHTSQFSLKKGISPADQFEQPDLPTVDETKPLDNACRSFLAQHLRDFYPHLKYGFWFHFFVKQTKINQRLAQLYYQASIDINLSPAVAAKCLMLLFLQTKQFQKANSTFLQNLPQLRSKSSVSDYKSFIELKKAIENQPDHGEHSLDPREGALLQWPRPAALLLVFFKHTHYLSSALDEFVFRAKVHLNPSLTRVLFLYTNRKKLYSSSASQILDSCSAKQPDPSRPMYQSAALYSRRSQENHDPVALLEFSTQSSKLAALEHLDQWSFNLVDLLPGKIEIDRIFYRNYIQGNPLLKLDLAERLRKAEMLGLEESDGIEETKDFNPSDFKLGLNYQAIRNRVNSHTQRVIQDCLKKQQESLRKLDFKLAHSVKVQKEAPLVQNKDRVACLESLISKLKSSCLT